MQSGFKSYKKDFEYSYAFGAFPTVELIKAKPDRVIKVLVSTSYREDGDFSLEDLCREKGIEVEYNDKLIRRIAPKENCYVVGVFNKYACTLDGDASHVALANPSNMGNLGTIIRTMLGFGVKNLAIIGGGADILDPKVVRASMGAIFRINFSYFDSIESYTEKYGSRDLYPFIDRKSVV